MDLWSSADCAAWAAAFDRYPVIVQAQQVNGLAEVDTWYREELPGLIAGRDPAYATLDELQWVTAWKMKRGVWRERNRKLLAGNPPAVVEVTSRTAFAAAPHPRRPLALLSDLAGVGPATASGLLAAYRPDLYPFFDELVAAQIPGLGPVAWTAPYYVRYAAALYERAAALRSACPDHAWTAQDVEQALWAASGGKAGAAATG